MVTTKVITIKKRGGGTRRQAVEVLKSGKFKFIKNTSAKLKGKARSAGKRIKSATKRRSGSKKTNKQPSRSGRSMKGGLHLYPKSSAKKIAAKAGIGLAIGLAIRLSTMFINNRDVREIGARGASIGASYGGGGTGQLAYQSVDAVLSRAIAGRMSLGTTPQSIGLIIGGA